MDSLSPGDTNNSFTRGNAGEKSAWKSGNVAGSKIEARVMEVELPSDEDSVGGS